MDALFEGYAKRHATECQVAHEAQLAELAFLSLFMTRFCQLYNSSFKTKAKELDLVMDMFKDCRTTGAEWDAIFRTLETYEFFSEFEKNTPETEIESEVWWQVKYKKSRQQLQNEFEERQKENQKKYKLVSEFHKSFPLRESYDDYVFVLGIIDELIDEDGNLDFEKINPKDDDEESDKTIVEKMKEKGIADIETFRIMYVIVQKIREKQEEIMEALSILGLV